MNLDPCIRCKGDCLLGLPRRNITVSRNQRLFNSSLERWIEYRHFEMKIRVRHKEIKRSRKPALHSRPGSISIRSDSSCSSQGRWDLRQDYYLFVLAPRTVKRVPSLSLGQRLSVNPKSKCDKHAQLGTSRIKWKFQHSRIPRGSLRTQLPAPLQVLIQQASRPACLTGSQAWAMLPSRDHFWGSIVDGPQDRKMKRIIRVRKLWRAVKSNEL